VPQCHTQGQGPVGQGQGLILKAKAKDSKFVLEDTSRPRTKAKDNNTGSCTVWRHGCSVVHTRRGWFRERCRGGVAKLTDWLSEKSSYFHTHFPFTFIKVTYTVCISACREVITYHTVSTLSTLLLCLVWHRFSRFALWLYFFMFKSSK